MERRSFFRLVGLSAATVVAGGALASCEASGAAPKLSNPQVNPDRVAGEPPISFSSEVDVLIVGSGIAGLSCAMAPIEAGRSVLVVDKRDLLGGESFDACGIMQVSGAAIQKNAGIDQTADAAWEARKQELATAGATDLEAAKRLFLASPSWVDHLVDAYGAQFATPREQDRTGMAVTFLLPKNGLGDMESVMAPLRDGLAGRGVTFTLSERASAFILDDEGAVCGMRLHSTKTGAATDIRARCTVIATGGFASNQELVENYVPGQVRMICLTTASMGEGQVLCAAAGGQLSGMNVPAPLVSDLPEVGFWGLFGPLVDVDPRGARFAREDDPGAVAAAAVAQNLGFWWTIFDKQLTEGSQSRSIAECMSKNAKRFIGPFDTLEDVAEGTGVSADALKATFARYDDVVAAKRDAALGRTLFLEALTGPYYAVKQLPARYLTRGGVKVDNDGRVLAAGDVPLAGAYACGACAASGVHGIVSAGTSGYLVGQALVSALG